MQQLPDVWLADRHMFGGQPISEHCTWPSVQWQRLQLSGDQDAPSAYTFPSVLQTGEALEDVAVGQMGQQWFFRNSGSKHARGGQVSRKQRSLPARHRQLRQGSGRHD